MNHDATRHRQHLTVTMFKTALVVLLVVATLSLIHLDHAFGVPGAALLGFACLCLPLIGLSALLWFALRRRKVALLIACGAFGSLLGYMAIAVPIGRWQSGKSQASGNRIIAAVQAYRSAEGRLPSRLDDLVPRYLDEIPVSSMGLFVRVPFYYRAGVPDGFRLGYPAPGWLLCERSATTTWVCDD